ncbi:hypothetical protein C1645_821748 [Glomus cerebriforme]|uniref:Protein kinase domain-containing protein n=1 Tax=Glomus cerebriforme TaxID=658196 RepID=A0A397T0D9_9GLOM|nr:hypothetical protein C1645_821748 [Glomus cerebriforme]
MVLEYAEHGSLRNYLDKNYDKLYWQTKIIDLYYIAHSLYIIHENELIHRDLHIGNVLRIKNNACITDIGLLISGLPPYHNMSHYESLAMKICRGFRPSFNIKVPDLSLKVF